MRGRIIIGAVTVMTALVVVAGAGASDGKIRQDMKDGRLDGTYSQQQLSEYLNNAMTQGYGNPVATPAAPAPTSGVAGAQSPTLTPAAQPSSGVAGAQSPGAAVAEVGRTGTLPFTGVDLALLTIGGFLMLALGLGARRLGRNH